MKDQLARRFRLETRSELTSANYQVWNVSYHKSVPKLVTTQPRSELAVMTTLALEVPEQITSHGDTYVLNEVSDSGLIRIYRCERDWNLAVIELPLEGDDGVNPVLIGAPANEKATTWKCWTPVDHAADDEDIVREDGTTPAVRIRSVRRGS